MPDPAKTDIDIAARALVLIGASPISSFSDGSSESTVASNIYEDLARGLLTSYRWRFATGQEQLSRLADAPVSRWDAAYQLPSGLLMLHAVTVSDFVIDYDRYEDMVYCDASSNDTVVADYTFRVNENKWPPYFIELAELTLASHFASAVARSGEIAKEYAQKAELQARRSRSLDSQSQTTRRVDTSYLTRGRRSRSSPRITLTYD